LSEYELLLYDLDICNCGNPKETVEWIRDGLLFFAEKCPNYQTPAVVHWVSKTAYEWSREWYQDKHDRQLKHFGNDASYQFFANWANTQGYAEHGSNITASWITGAGEELLERIEKVWENLPEDA
jgi:hypothetical protein